MSAVHFHPSAHPDACDHSSLEWCRKCDEIVCTLCGKVWETACAKSHVTWTGSGTADGGFLRSIARNIPID